jgi:hypothetical protein
VVWRGVAHYGTAPHTRAWHGTAAHRVVLLYVQDAVLEADDVAGGHGLHVGVVVLVPHVVLVAVRNILDHPGQDPPRGVVVAHGLRQQPAV